MRTIQELTNLCAKLKQAEPYSFESLKPSMLPDDKGGVYYIYRLVNGVEETLYVGRATNIRRRLYTNHLQGNLSTARLKKYLIEDSSIPTVTNLKEAKDYLKKHCRFRFIEISDSHERGLVEGGLTFLLDAKYIEKEH